MMWKSVAIVVTLLLIGCVESGSPTTELAPPSASDPQYQVGPFSLTERSGKTITDQDLHGSVWVASFVFTRCTGPCPQVTATMARLQSELKDVPGLKLVTFTVDPSRDDTAELKRYASHFQADPERWLFLTGEQAKIHQLLREQFKQGVDQKMGPDVKPGDEFEHSTRLVLVDKNGLIRGIFSGIRNDSMPNAAEQFETDLAGLKERIHILNK